MAITAGQVKELRDLTGAGFMECKAALTEASGRVEDATTILRTKGLAQATKRSGRTTSQGLVGSYIHMGSQVGVLVELNSESDFVARTDDFLKLIKEVAMHIAAANPLYVRREDISNEDIEREKSIYRAQVDGSSKPAHIIEQIINGKLGGFYEKVVLLDQPSIRDPNTTIGEMVAATIAKLGENITVSRFARFKVGERINP